MSMGLTSVNIIKKIDNAAIEQVRNAIFENAQAKAALVAKNDVMNDARAQFTKSANPFSVANTDKDKSSSSSLGYSGSSQKQTTSNQDVKKVALKNKISLSAEMEKQAVQESVMRQASGQISGSDDLMRKLKFLNTQTAITGYSKAS